MPTLSRISRDFLASGGPTLGAGPSPPFTHLNGGPIQWGQASGTNRKKSPYECEDRLCTFPSTQRQLPKDKIFLKIILKS